jgi:hypothetical protein
MNDLKSIDFIEFNPKNVCVVKSGRKCFDVDNF